MPRQSKHRITCEHFTWNLLVRDGVHYADGRINKPSLGKHSLGTRDREEALRRLAELDQHQAVERGLIARAPTAPAGKLSIEAGWNHYKVHCERPSVLKGVTESTRKRYRAIRDHHQRFCRRKAIEYWHDFDEDCLKRYVASRDSAGAADATISTEGTTIKQVVNFLIDEKKLLDESHRLKLSVSCSDESDTYCYSQDEVVAMVELCRSTEGLEWLLAVIIALATTGMRIGEAVALRWGDIDFEAKFITLPDNRQSGRRKKLGLVVRTNKGGYTRRIPIHPLLLTVLRKLRRHVDGRVLHGARGGVLKADTVRTVLIRDVLGVLKKRFPTPEGEIGFEHGRLHSFRHYFVSQAFLGGASEGEIREWVGHADSRIVERYRHLHDKDAQRKMSQIDFLGAGDAIEREPGAQGTGSNGKDADTNEGQHTDVPAAIKPPDQEHSQRPAPDVPDAGAA